MKITQKTWNSFLCGFTLAFDFSGVVGNAMLKKEMKNSSARIIVFLNMVDKEKNLSDRENLTKDWHNIGNDFRKALLCQE